MTAFLNLIYFMHKRFLKNFILKKISLRFLWFFLHPLAITKELNDLPSINKYSKLALELCFEHFRAVHFAENAFSISDTWLSLKNTPEGTLRFN